VTTGAGLRSLLQSPPPLTMELWHHPYPKAWDTAVAPSEGHSYSCIILVTEGNLQPLYTWLGPQKTSYGYHYVFSLVSSGINFAEVIPSSSHLRRRNLQQGWCSNHHHHSKRQERGCLHHQELALVVAIFHK
jgi:hypothetical protein